jgi:hypothetical protein
MSAMWINKIFVVTYVRPKFSSKKQRMEVRAENADEALAVASFYFSSRGVEATRMQVAAA